jgi:hypothetical protein
MGRRFNARRIKIHRPYTIEAIATVTGVHIHTVRSWIRKGLPTIDKRRPTLVQGRALRAFFEAARTASKKPLRTGEMYCLKCRSPKRPAGMMADYVPVSDVSGNLRGICPTCDKFIYRRVSLAKLDAVCGDLDIAFPQAMERITE